MAGIRDKFESVGNVGDRLRDAGNRVYESTHVAYDSWRDLEERDYDDDMRFHDDYDDQQLRRGKFRKIQRPGMWHAAAGVLSLLLLVAVWLVFSVGEFVLASVSQGGLRINVMTAQIGSSSTVSFGECLLPTLPKFVASALTGLVAFAIIDTEFMRKRDVNNMQSDHTDINQNYHDQHIALPEELQRKFDYAPDAGMHFSTSVSSMISHMAITNDGLQKVPFVIRHADEDDDSEFYSIVDGELSNLDIKMVDPIDMEFQAALFEASGMPPRFRKAYDTRKIPYNPGNKNRDKLKGYDTVADLINGDWELPLYEPQRPGGVYLVDTAPVNTMVLAITRAGKGQTVIEPTIDMWLREKNPNNMVINDPKGELLVKNYVPATVRGFHPVQFNLINSLKTDIYNPLAMAAQAAREGDSVKAAQYIENIAEVFFPLDGGEDPVWPNAANNAFKRAAYGLIDYYLEEEREIRRACAARGLSPQVVETKIDNLWGKVTLYNSYQLFVQLTAKKKNDPATEFNNELKESLEPSPDGKGERLKPDSRLGRMSTDEYNAERDRVTRQSKLWDGQPQVDLLTLYFNATERLPRNSMRTLVNNANNALKAMGGAEKMMASVYGIAITAMSFFADPTIMRLTSGTLSQNVDLAGLSFPRRIGVRLHADFVERYHLMGMQCRWQAFADPAFEESLGRDFYHEDIIGGEGWARYYFKGILPEMQAFFRLEIRNPQTGALVKRLFFRFEKAYQTSLNGRTYVTDPVLDQKIIKNGTLVEMRPSRDSEGHTVFRDGHLMFKTRKIVYQGKSGDGKERYVAEDRNVPVVISELVRYSEKPKAIFLVTPPHLMKYAKLILILIKQLVDLNFDQSYMTKSNQKPLYKTRFMLDELGNLQSEGHGISGFETMLSIGLGQEQQFTIILQTLQQLRDVYGDSVDKIVQGNAQPLSSKIATPEGWKTMGEMSVGAEVLTPRGTKTQVKGVYPKGVRKVYRVTRRDGSSCLVCDEHLWKVKVS